MMDGTIEVVKTRPSLVGSIRSIELRTRAGKAFAAVGRLMLAVLAAIMVPVRRLGGVCVRAANAVRMPVRYRRFAALETGFVAAEVRALDVAKLVENRERRIVEILEIARMAHRHSRDTGPALRAIVLELADRSFWMRNQSVTFLAARMACSAAGLAAISSQPEEARDAYLVGQTFYGKVSDTDRRIGLAVAFSDAAALMGSLGDQASWLDSALELACMISDKKRRLGAACYVAHKMVAVRIPPSQNQVDGDRFAVGAEPAPESLESVRCSGNDDIVFDTL